MSESSHGSFHFILALLIHVNSLNRKNLNFHVPDKFLSGKNMMVKLRSSPESWPRKGRYTPASLPPERMFLPAQALRLERVKAPQWNLSGHSLEVRRSTAYQSKKYLIGMSCNFRVPVLNNNISSTSCGMTTMTGPPSNSPLF